MRLGKASAWYYNKGNNDISLADLGIYIKRGEVVDLFSLKPSLLWSSYIKSLESGSLKMKNLVKVDSPKDSTNYRVTKPDIKTIIAVRGRSTSTITVGKERGSYLQELKDSFGVDHKSLSNEEAWTLEKDKYLEQLEVLDTGNDGEVFSDNLFKE